MTINIISMRRKLDLIADYLGDLKPLASIDIDAFLSDPYKILATERLLEIIIQAALDINKHLLKAHFGSSKKENTDSFIDLVQHGVIEPELAAKLVKSAGLRNRLAHEYENIDRTMLFQFIPMTLDQYSQYVYQITSFLDSLENINE